MKVFSVFLLSLFLFGCGSNSSNNNSTQAGGSSDFSDIQQSPTSTPLVISAFGIFSSSTAAGFVAFYTGNRYASGAIQQVTSQHYRIAAVVGNYQQNGSAISVTAVKTSCIQLSQQYPPGSSRVTGSVGGDSITVTNSSTTVMLNKVALQSNSTTNGLVIEWGCFDAAGNFTPQSWSNL